MTLITDLRQVTDRIIVHRFDVARAENAVRVARHNLLVAESDLAVSRAALMANPDAGTNDNARRAYADRETTDERENVIDLRAALVRAEQDAALAAALGREEDDRRYLELVARMTIAGAVETGPIPTLAYYTGPDGDPFARVEAEMEVAA